MISIGVLPLYLLLLHWPACSAEASIVTFDFDTGTPPTSDPRVFPLTGLPQTSGGLTANFIPEFAPSSTAGFSIQNASTTFFVLSQFSGNYIYPNSLTPGSLDIAFSQNVDSISLTFATADLEAEADTPATVLLSAYESSKASFVGSASAHGAYIGDTWPEGTLSLSSLTPFNLVEISIPLPASTADFFLDNVTVSTPNTVPLPAALPLFATGLGGLGLLGWRRKRKAQAAA